MSQMGRNLALTFALSSFSIAAQAQTERYVCNYSEPAASNCLYPRVIPGTEGQHVVLMDAQTATDTGTLCGGVAVGHKVYFEFTPAVSGPVTVSTCHPATTYDTVLEVATGVEFCETGTIVACNDDTAEPGCPYNCTGYASKASFNANAGWRYVIRVGSYQGNPQGCFLCLGLIVTIGHPCGMAPTNIVCPSAYELSGTPGTHEAQFDVTDIATPVEDWQCSTNVGHIVWFRVTSTVNGPLTFTTCHPNTTYDTVLRALRYLDEPCIGYFQTLGCVDDTADPACSNACGSYRGSSLTLNAVAGQTYWFQVGAYNNNSAGCTLCLGVYVTIVDACANEQTPPIAAISSPGPLACVCLGGVNVIGSAYDPDGTFESYTLEYQSASGDGWTMIASSTSPVSNGVLGVWNTAGLPAGEQFYVLRLTVTNLCGMSSTAVQVVWNDQQFDDYPSFRLRYPSNGALVSGNVCVDGTIWDHCFGQYTVMYKPVSGGSFQPVDPNHPVYTGTVLNDPLASWNTTGLGVTDGDYILRVTASTACGYQRTQDLLVTVDNAPPTGIITSPVNCSYPRGVVSVIGTATDAHLGSWALYYTGGAANGWVVISSGTTPVVNSVLGSWNTQNLTPCAYTLRLVVTDATVPDCGSPLRAQREYLTSVLVRLAAPGDLNCDGLVNFADINPFVSCLGGGNCGCP